MKMTQSFKFTVEMVNNKHSVIATFNGQERLYFVSELGLHTAQAVRDTISSDFNRHGAYVVDFHSLPIVQTRINRKSNAVRFTA